MAVSQALRSIQQGPADAVSSIWLFNSWMAFRLNTVGALFAFLVAALVVGTKQIDASLAGFALSFALEYCTVVIYTIRSYASLEMDMNATERIIEYTRIESEDQGGTPPPASWPSNGRLEFRNVVAGYSIDSPPVLRNLSFTIEANQRVGIVGRTGAGKSSLTLALFRFIRASKGSILVDGIDVSTIPLHELRSRLAIIPQVCALLLFSPPGVKSPTKSPTTTNLLTSPLPLTGSRPLLRNHPLQSRPL